LVFSYGLLWLAAAVFYLPGVRDAVASDAWPAVAGRIDSTGHVYHQGKRSAHYELDVRYTYRVGDRTYTGHRVDFIDGVRAFTEAAMEQEARRYGLVAGATVTVHYDPADPARSVLWTGFDPRRGGSLGILVVGMPMMAALYGLGRRRRARSAARRRAEGAGTPIGAGHAAAG
jgi:hypothetical protein